MRRRPTPGSLCRPCGKRVFTEQKAVKRSLVNRASVRKLSALEGGWHRTHAYACPHGNGWHIGRAKAGTFPTAPKTRSESDASM